MVNTYCTDGGKVAYKTYKEAIDACRDSADCRAVNDTDCDDDHYYLCSTATTLKFSSKGSCVYSEGKYLYDIVV